MSTSGTPTLLRGDPDLCFSNNATASIAPTDAEATVHVVNPQWILIDSASTVNLFSNRSFLRNIREAPNGEELTTHSNGGVSTTNLIGDLPGFGIVWLDERAIANVLSLSSVRQRFHVTQDSSEYDGIRLLRPDGEVLEFFESSKGLFHYDATPEGCNLNSSAVTDYSFITTVAQNLRLYTVRQRRGIADAKRLYELIGRPSHATFVRMITHNQLPNCPITFDDAQNMLKVYGPDTSALKGKTTRTTSEMRIIT